MLRERFIEKMLSLAPMGAGKSRKDSPAVLLAVSGGVDSMSMAHLFKISECCPFVVATVNFSLRGAESDKDEQLVVDWCKSNGIKCFSQRFDTETYAANKGISTQMAARDLRYEWFYQLCVQNGYSYIAVAHNLNDKVETLFINLLRGTGIRGLSSIRETSHPAGGEVTVIRPLIEFTRAEIEQFAREKSVPFRNDHTNTESHYSRNKLRNLAFPIFEEINPSFLSTIEREIEIFSRAGSVIDERLHEVRERVLSVKTGGDESARISISKLKLQREPEFWLFLLLEGYGFSSAVVSEIFNSFNSTAGKIFNSAEYQVLKDRDYLIVRPFSSANECEIPVIRPSVKFYDIYPGFEPKPSDSVFYLDAGLTGTIINFRKWRDGDRFRPLGMQGSKKISDYLTDIKRDRFVKEKRIVATTEDDRIICLLGERIDHNFRITEKTRKILEISV